MDIYRKFLKKFWPEYYRMLFEKNYDVPWYLRCSISFLQASGDERLQKCNGAGPGHYAGFVPDTIWGLPITICADIHDWDYFEGSKLKTREERIRAKQCADDVFLLNLFTTIRVKTTKLPILRFILVWLRESRATTYHVAVQEFGQDAFDKCRKASPSETPN